MRRLSRYKKKRTSQLLWLIGYNIISLFLILSPVRFLINDYIFLGFAKMAFYSSFFTKYISHYIRNFKILSILVCARCVRSGSFYICFLEISKYCAAYAGMLQKCEFLFWSVLERQKAKLDAYLKKKVALKKKAFDKMIEYRARIK